MDIHSIPGVKVIYAGSGGWDNDKAHAKKYLAVGKEYTVKATEVHSWHTDVWLEEIPGVCFNSVMFDEVVVEKS